MTLVEFQMRFGPEWRKFLETPAGNAGLAMLHGLRPPPVCEPVEHQAVYRLGVVAGYEQSEKNLILFITTPAGPQKSVPQDYGVKDKDKAPAEDPAETQ